MSEPLKIYDISAISLANVPARLRQLADEIDRDGHDIRNCVVVLDCADRNGTVVSFGREGDIARTLGVLHYGAAMLTRELTDGES